MPQDGVTVAKHIEFKDRMQNMGAQLVRQVASKTNDIAGDGTTTATVLARAVYSEGCKSVAAGMNPMELRRGMTIAQDAVLKWLDEHATDVSSSEEIAQVATISANSDKAVGDLLSSAMEKVGREGVITVQDGRTLEDELEVVEGMRFDRGFISPYFINNAKTQRVEFEDAYLLLVEKKVASFQSIVHIIEAVLRESKPIVIVAEDVESEALAALIINKLRAGAKVAAVKAPGFGDNRKANLQDIAELTGATVISTDVGLALDTATLDQLGRAKKVTITKDETLILDGAGAPEAISERCEAIREQMEATTSEYEREKLQERLAKLAGGVAVIKVGGASEVEVGEKKDRVVDALNATRAAVEEGIVPGGGTALLYASKTIDALIEAEENQDVKVGMRIVQKAIRKPAETIASNAGVSGEVVVGKLLESTDFRYGYNAGTGKFVDMITEGIIDPKKVVRTALLDAVSVAGLMTTTEAAVFERPSENSDGGMGGGMGGMGGMGGGMF
jgi:chaperonin GroEL